VGVRDIPPLRNYGGAGQPQAHLCGAQGRRCDGVKHRRTDLKRGVRLAGR
jgi:hypothetical protein